jgi:adenine phosphoribosyltransferase
MSMEHITAAIRDVPDFPKPGILFKDITPILADPILLADVIASMARRHHNQHIDKVAAVESRGFIFGVGVAQALKAGFIPIRKKGKLPFQTIEEDYDLEYGSATLAMHVDAIDAGETVLIIDDLLATGGTAAATVQLVERAGGFVQGLDFLIELDFLEGRSKLTGYDVYSHIHF